MRTQICTYDRKQNLSKSNTVFSCVVRIVQRYIKFLVIFHIFTFQKIRQLAKKRLSQE